MTLENQKTTASEICTIRILFPVQSDEDALSYKRKITEVLSDVEGVQIQFSIMTAPAGMPIGSQIR